MAELIPVRAAGGVVWRPGRDDVEVCVVHRPRYDDWSLPKGKLEPGEHPLVAAVREVAEEANIRAVPQVRLSRAQYTMRDGVPKTVDYWSMRAVDEGGFEAHTEVDKMRWLPVDDAAQLVSYSHDVSVLRAFAALPPVSAVLALVRHASAGKRGTWSGPDAARPLDEEGWAQARGLVPLLELVRPRRLVAATVRRCRQTLDPLAERLDLPIEADSALDEPAPGEDPDGNALAASRRLRELAAAGVPAAVCSQGKVIPDALAHLTGAAADDYTTPKGTGWLLAFADDRLLSTDRLAAAESGRVLRRAPATEAGGARH
ncbi:MAG TPA: bifunctional NUDIX hydrolase/histidine phosphatase family protein [Micromonosporaceae bacterium]|nr:bifunctional NUDIX hydrolase/histidine phosphatase family protein [Micromonosporaceae bacterium]